MLSRKDLSHRERIGNRCQHGLRRMTQYDWPIRERVVDVLVAIDVGQPGPGPARIEQWHRAFTVSGVAEVAANTAGKMALCRLVERLRFGILHG